MTSKYNMLIGCDQDYFNTWAKPLLISLQKYKNDINLHCHVVNPDIENFIEGVDITYENLEFVSTESKISYLQSVRFLVAEEKFNKRDKVFTVDADSVCTRKIEKAELENLFLENYVLRHPKDARWLAGFVVLSDPSFRNTYANELKEAPLERWRFGRDQLILNQMSTMFKFKSLPVSWMSIGKNRNNSVFLTLKGSQKIDNKYLDNYKTYLNADLYNQVI